MDLAIFNYIEDNVHVRLGSDTGISFAPPIDVVLGDEPISIAVRDFIADKNQDSVTAIFVDNKITTFQRLSRLLCFFRVSRSS